MSETEPRFFNRELSWLEFNRRVLEEAQDPANPPLERLKFLAITGSNLDEFFMVRVGSLQWLLAQGKSAPDPAGLTAAEQLSEIGRRAHRMAGEQSACLKAIASELAACGIRRRVPAELAPAQLQHAEQIFEHEIFPLLTPLAVPDAGPFPLLPGLAVCLLVRLARPRQVASGQPRYVVVALPRGLNRLIALPAEKGHEFILAEDIVRLHLGRLCPGAVIAESALFRITRNADLEVQEDLAGDLMEKMQRILRQRRQSACVRLEIGADASPAMARYLRRSLVVRADDSYAVAGPLALTSFFGLALSAPFESLRHPVWEPQPSPTVKPGESMFAAIARRDVLLYHPYESFDPVLRLVTEAAGDPDVLAIKQILYRTSPNSPVIAALVRAAEQGKQVTAIVELKARFDEARNIEGAHALEQAGATVFYGIKGLKTHAKLCLIVRREPTGIRRYLHFGTGNYNEITARIYADVSFMTCDEDLAADASLFFNTITGYSQPVHYRKIAAAPIGLRERLLYLIESETLSAKQERKGLILAKLNSLVDPALIEALYAASQAGVTIRLNVRGICALRPGVPVLSANIEVVSVVDRFLEHSRILYFHHDGDPQVFISSADWMPRNLDRRIELLVPVEDAEFRERLRDILETSLNDPLKGRVLQPTGHYARRSCPADAEGLGSQDAVYRAVCRRASQADIDRRQSFEPYQSNHQRSG
jgi:polyphosphate kinase